MYHYSRRDLLPLIVNDGIPLCLVFNTYNVPITPILERLYGIYPNLRRKLDKAYKEEGQINNPLVVMDNNSSGPVKLCLIRSSQEISHQNLIASIVEIERRFRAALEDVPCVGEFALGPITSAQQVALEDVLFTSVITWTVQDPGMKAPPITRRRLGLADFDFED